MEVNKNNFTPEDFKLMKKDLKLTNKDIAKIIGSTEANIKIQTRPNKPLGKWAVSMCYVWNHYKKPII